jgi:hypothetical protein
MAVDHKPPAAGQGYRSPPSKKWVVIGAFILLLMGGSLFMLTVEMALILCVPLLVAGAVYGLYHAIQNKLHHRDRRR